MCGISSREAKEGDDLRVRAGGKRGDRLGQLGLPGGGSVYSHQTVLPLPRPGCRSLLPSPMQA